MTNIESSLLAGSLLFLAYYAARRFNSEPITLDAQQRSVRLGKDPRSPHAEILSQLITQPLPLFTTTRDRYRRSMVDYVLGYLLVFLAIVYGPTLLGSDLLKDVGEMTGIPISQFPVALGERILFALFLLTGVVNAIPAIRIWDEWFIKTLREKALIPTEVKLTARQLLDCGLTNDAARALGISSTFSAGDVLNLPSLASKLKDPSRVFDRWLVTQLSSHTRVALADYHGKGSDPAPLQQALVQDLNCILHGAKIYEQQRFADIILGRETQALMLQNPQRSDLEHLNRLLIEDAYPCEVSRIQWGNVQKLPPYIDSRNPAYRTGTRQTEDLANRWNTVVYLWRNCVDLPHRTRRYRLFKARFQPEMTAIQNHVDEMAKRIHSALLPPPPGSQMPPGIPSDLEEEVEQLCARVALFASLLVFSGDRNINDINDRFREIGFNKDPLPWPRLDLNAWILSLLIVFVLMLVITVGYEVFLEFQQSSLPQGRVMGVPGSFGTAFLWSFLGAGLFGASFMMAILTHFFLRLRRYEQHILHEGVDLSDKPHLVKDSAVVFAFCLVTSWILLFALDLLARKNLDWHNWQIMKTACTKALPWSFLVATAGVFAIFHHIHTREDLKPRWLSRALVHGGLLLVVGAFAAFAALAGKQPITEFEPSNWYFVTYAAAFSLAVGFATPFAFRFADAIRLRGAAAGPPVEPLSDSTTHTFGL